MFRLVSLRSANFRSSTQTVQRVIGRPLWRGFQSSIALCSQRRWESPLGKDHGRPVKPGLGVRLLGFTAVVVGIGFVVVLGSSLLIFVFAAGCLVAVLVGGLSLFRRLRGPSSGAAAANAEHLLMRRFLGNRAVSPSGPLTVPLGTAALVGTMLNVLLQRMAGSITEESRLGRIVHYNLQQRLSGSPTIRNECGRGVVLGFPDTYTCSSSSSSAGIEAEQRILVTFEGPLLHERMGHRGRLQVEALVHLPLIIEDAAGDTTEAVSAAISAQRAARKAERRARLDSAPPAPEDETASSRRHKTTMRFLRDTFEDLEDEARLAPPGSKYRLSGVSIEVTRAVLRTPSGAEHEVTSEVGGVFFDDVTQKHVGSSAPGARVIDAEFFSKLK